MAWSLNDLLDEDSLIEQYYLSLPESVQRAAAAHSLEIHSEQDFLEFVRECSGYLGSVGRV